MPSETVFFGNRLVLGEATGTKLSKLDLGFDREWGGEPHGVKDARYLASDACPGQGGVVCLADKG